MVMREIARKESISSLFFDKQASVQIYTNNKDIKELFCHCRYLYQVVRVFTTTMDMYNSHLFERPHTSLLPKKIAKRFSSFETSLKYYAPSLFNYSRADNQ